MSVDLRPALRVAARTRPRGASLTVVHTPVGDGDLVAPVGELDLATVPRLVTSVAGLLRRGRRRIVVDLAGLAFVDPVGLAGLLDLLCRTTRAGGTFVLAAPPPHVVRLLALTRLDREFTVVAEPAQALGAAV